MKKTLNKGVKEFLLLILIFFANFAQAYEFKESAEKIEQEIFAKQNYNNTVTLAIVFDNQNRSLIKDKVDLVKLKKEIAFDFAEKFRVTDPFITQDILDNNNLDSLILRNNSQALSQFAKRTEASHILFVSFVPEESRVPVVFELRDPSGFIVSVIQQQIEPNKEKLQEVPVTEIREIPPPIVENGDADSRMKPTTHNETWMPFSPTAFLAPRNNAIEATLWIKEPSDNDVRLLNLRYDFRYERVQAGVQLYSQENKKLHSAYSMVRFLAIDESMLPFNVVLGIRHRLYWDEDNLDFVNEDEEVEAKNNQLNNFSYILAISGTNDTLGASGNFYWDNQKMTIGGKVFITPQIKILCEGVYFYHQDPLVETDLIAGVELHGDSLYSISLAYQMEAEAALLGTKFNW